MSFEEDVFPTLSPELQSVYKEWHVCHNIFLDEVNLATIALSENVTAKGMPDNGKRNQSNIRRHEHQFCSIHESNGQGT